MSKVLEPGSIIGILGGGQLGQMLCLAATRLGFLTHVYAECGDSPAARAASFETRASYDDHDALLAFGKHVDVVTYEFENIPVASAKAASIKTLLCPNLKTLTTSQDRKDEKTFLRDIAKVAVTPFEPVTSIEDAKAAAQRLGLPLVLKTRRLGYDGKGQVIIRRDEDFDAAFKKLGNVPLIAEAFIPFRREVSIVAARNDKGEIAAYPLVENTHQNHILHTSLAPAENDNGQARSVAEKILKALDYVGVLAVEFFELEDGSLLVNEIAPRVHNSGHWTQNAGCVDQFELHIRAITGWPLGSVTPLHPVEMTNLIGKTVSDVSGLASDKNTFVHLYGKSEIRPGRKMGHVNRILS